LSCERNYSRSSIQHSSSRMSWFSTRGEMLWSARHMLKGHAQISQ
jgi:hypothetical protein